jgi:hypothetical protein
LKAVAFEMRVIIKKGSANLIIKGIYLDIRGNLILVFDHIHSRCMQDLIHMYIIKSTCATRATKRI